jgi:16S rRNA processing protein RimM
MPRARSRRAGPPAAGGPDFITAGKIRRPHGVHGEVVVEVDESHLDWLKEGNTVFIGNKHEEKIILTKRPHKEGCLLKFEGISTPEQAGLYRNFSLAIDIQQLPSLLDGKFHQHELLGMEVYNEIDKYLGKLKEILETGANDVYVVEESSGEEMLLPAIEDVIIKIDPLLHKMTVRLLPGLEWTSSGNKV